jgi:hypothetical protein
VDNQHSGKLYLASREFQLLDDCRSKIDLVTLGTRFWRTVTKLVVMGINIAKKRTKFTGTTDRADKSYDARPAFPNL